MSIEIPYTDRHNENSRKVRGDAMPCVVCGKGIKTEKQRYMVHVHGGGGELVTEREAYVRNFEQGREAEDMYFYPIGPDCLRRHPELRPYVTEMRDDDIAENLIDGEVY